jgi:hypothetical protein
MYLPDAVLSRIGEFLGVRDQAIGACVCRQWRDAFHADDAKMAVLDDEFQRAVRLALLGVGTNSFESSVPGFRWTVCGEAGRRSVYVLPVTDEHDFWVHGDVICGPPTVVHYPDFRTEPQPGFYPHGDAPRQSPTASLPFIMQAEKYWRRLALHPVYPVYPL